MLLVWRFETHSHLMEGIKCEIFKFQHTRNCQLFIENGAKRVMCSRIVFLTPFNVNPFPGRPLNFNTGINSPLVCRPTPYEACPVSWIFIKQSSIILMDPSKINHHLRVLKPREKVGRYHRTLTRFANIRSRFRRPEVWPLFRRASSSMVWWFDERMDTSALYGLTTND